MQNHLKNQTSPYLLQHVNNPVDWYPWGIVLVIGAMLWHMRVLKMRKY